MIKLSFEGLNIQVAPRAYGKLVPMLRSFNKCLYYKNEEVLELQDNNGKIIVRYLYDSTEVSINDFLENTTMESY